MSNKQVKIFNRDLKSAVECIKGANTKGVPFSVGHNFIDFPDVSGGEIHVNTDDNRHVLISYGEANDSGYGVSVYACRDIKLPMSGGFELERGNEDSELFQVILERTQ